MYRKRGGECTPKAQSHWKSGPDKIADDYNSPDMSFLRFLMLLSLVAWIGGLIFFAFVLAPTAFQVLPDTHLAGNVVGRALGRLHWIAIISGIVFLLSSLIYSRLTDGTAHLFALRHVLVCLMLGLTLVSQFWIIPRMDTLRAQVGDFGTVTLNNPARVQFDALHVWSTRVEGAVLLFGLVAVYLTASLFDPSRR
jgi:uncharacterized membrane protein